ncbi:MAG TPA: hypothetical protein DCR06_07420 [Planctomycetaceae bacterium]|nr:MAG: hypothetical protein CBC98_03365 [Planctomycetaceae bacterium TMED138]RZO65536.1 MAG: hypothetical protein EVA78_02455 [Phycisphaeraceae bacterium]HAO72416.1 hypothetical protein [Planctomycetaceae bacterium]HAU49130.1 hypothetical protein [Planctomycetaceae bacterium]|tara:strand:- start:963 stop:1730 length:768 start_codon:yes stop_codon:yes gene_type:complete
MTDSQPSDTPKNLEELSQAIDHLEKNLDSISRSQRSGRTTVLIGSLLLLAMIGIFGINLFQTLKTQINEETLQAALQAKADELLPTLQDKFTKAAMEAVPTYRELALERLKTLRPKLQAMITEEAKSLANRMPVMLQEKANESLQRVTDKVAADVKTEIPSLTPENVKRLSEITVEGMAIESEKLQKQIQTLTNVEVERISKLLDALPVEAAMNMNEELLQQRFMHNILLIVDRSVAPTMSVLKTDSPFSTSDDL